MPTPRLSDLFDLSGRVALVTGASRGLGLQIARGLGQSGATLALVARKAEDLQATVEALVSEGIAAHAFPCDLGQDGSPADLVEAVLGRLGRLDILVNNAGATWGAPAEDYALEGWRKVIDLNITSLFVLTQAAAARAFLPSGAGVVLNVASIEGLQGHHPDRLGTIAYNTSKGAIINMTRALAAEWGPRNIRVNALAPGFFVSKMTVATVDAHGAEMIAGTPLGRLGGPTDLMGPAVLLASDAGRHITGHILVVDGGFTII